MFRFLFVFLISFFSFAQQQQQVDFISCHAQIIPNELTNSITGKINYEFKVVKSIDTIKIDAKNMIFNELLINGKSVKYKTTKEQLLLFEGFKKGKNKLQFSYNCQPKQALYFIGQDDNLQIWTQGQGKYTSHWLPSFDDVNEKVIFNISIKYKNDFTVLSNGKLKNVDRKRNGFDEKFKTLNFKMKKPMSSYLLMLAIGKFSRQTIKSNSGITLEFYLDKKDTANFEPTYRYSKQMFDYLEKEIGVKYPWKIYRQVPVRDFLYAGMENTSSTIFSQDFVVDSIGFNDRNYVWINAHELAHQWFGNMVTAKSSQHHWLQEGFAKYYEMLAEREVFGENYFYNKLFVNANRILVASKTDTIPIISSKASSLSYYEKGAWSLHYIRESVGENNFRKAVTNYLKKYKYKSVDTDDFLNEIKLVSNFNTENFKEVWLNDFKFPIKEANKLLLKNDFMKQLIEIQKLSDTKFENKKVYLEKIMQSEAYFPVKVLIIEQVKDENYFDKQNIIQSAMNSGIIEVRQAVAKTLQEIPIEFKDQYETLLKDDSYDTKELAFVNLINSFPLEKEHYIERVKNWKVNNKSLRILYLLYAQISDKLDINAKRDLYNELVFYTSAQFESSIRQNAIEASLQLNPKDEIVLRNLVNFATHFRWQYSKYAKTKIKDLIKDEEYKIIFKKIAPKLSDKELQIVEYYFQE